MNRFPVRFRICLLFVASSVAFSQSSGKPAEKIIFVRPDPVIVGSAEAIHLSADPVGGGINAVEDPGRRYHATADAKMNLLAVMNSDGSGITDLHINGYDPSVAPDGSKIAFCSLRDDQYSQIYVANADGTGEKRITKITSGDSCGPVWSHDGKRIAFYSFALTHPSRNPAIWIMDPDGSNMKKIVEHGMSASWSPDDRQMVFASNRDGKFQIYAMNADGTNVRRLTNNRAEESAPAWSPNGQDILFVSDRDGEHPALFTMAPDGSGQQRLVFSKRQDFCFPAWSLDGQTIAFTSLNRVGPQFIAVGEERPKCEMWTGEYQMFTLDNQMKTHLLTNTKYMAMKPAYGRLASSH
jgi:Tol biopolymer transport system component